MKGRKLKNMILEQNRKLGYQTVEFWRNDSYMFWLYSYVIKQVQYALTNQLIFRWLISNIAQ